MKASRQIDTERLRVLLDYNPETGGFHRKTGKHAGQPVGCIDKSKRGYMRIVLDGVMFYAHRLAWQHHCGSIPLDKQVDHINGNRSDNRIGNLRLASPRENQRNYSRPRTNSSGIKGVSFDKRTGRWKAQIRLSGERPVAYFGTIDGAGKWYQDMAARHYGEFAKPDNDNEPQAKKSAAG